MIGIPSTSFFSFLDVLVRTRLKLGKRAELGPSKIYKVIFGEFS